MNQYSMAQVLSHRPPMILLDQLSSYSGSGALCRVTITDESPFFQDGLAGVPSYIGIEYMAQTIAAFAGANALDGGESVKIGFLLGSRKYQTQVDRFSTGTTLDIEVMRLHQEDSGLSVFDCTIQTTNEKLAEARINVFQPPDPVQFLREQNG